MKAILLARARSEKAEDYIIYNQDGVWRCDFPMMAQIMDSFQDQYCDMRNDFIGPPLGEIVHAAAERFGWEVLYIRPRRPEPPNPPHISD